VKRIVKNSEPLAVVSLLPILPLLSYKVLLTLLSFGMFLLDLRVGERLAFGTYAWWSQSERATVWFILIQSRAIL
jgi:hypothetical protein